MTLSILTLAKVAVAGAAGYAAARWLSAPGNPLRVTAQPATPSATNNGVNHTASPDESWQPREGGHPGQEPVEFGASDRPRG